MSGPSLGVVVARRAAQATRTMSASTQRPRPRVPSIGRSRTGRTAASGSIRAKRSRRCGSARRPSPIGRPSSWPVAPRRSRRRGVVARPRAPRRRQRRRRTGKRARRGAWRRARRPSPIGRRRGRHVAPRRGRPRGVVACPRARGVVVRHVCAASQAKVSEVRSAAQRARPASEIVCAPASKAVRRHRVSRVCLRVAGGLC